MPYEVGPVIDVVSVSVLSGLGLPLHSSTVVLTGLPLRTRLDPWYFIKAFEFKLTLLDSTGYGVSWVELESVVDECDDGSMADSASCCLLCWDARMSTEAVPAALDAALSLES